MDRGIFGFCQEERTMIDIRLMREKPDWVKGEIAKLNTEAPIDAILDLDQQLNLGKRLCHQPLKDVAGQGAHQDHVHLLFLGLADDPLIVVPIIGMLKHQVIPHLHCVKRAGGDQFFHTNGRSLGGKADIADHPPPLSCKSSL
jgi:hypothetical protein